jgi:hypothetical protein
MTSQKVSNEISKSNPVQPLVIGSQSMMSAPLKSGTHNGYMQQIIQESAKKYPNIKSLIDKLDLT